MSSNDLKLMAVSALRSNPDWSGLHKLNSCSARARIKFLRWLDHSGLALHFFVRLRNAGELRHLRPDLQQALSRRYGANANRMRHMLAEFRMVSSALQERAIPHAFLKGFALVPEFCPDLALRHQSDLDVLIAPEFLSAASETLSSCGYGYQATGESGEYRFATPAQRVATLHDDIYQLPPQQEVELHTSIWNQPGRVRLSVPRDCLAHSRSRTIDDVRFTALSLEDTFLMQLLHAFGHVLGSWLRLSWLWEIHYFVEQRKNDEAFWQSFHARVGDDRRLRNAIGLVLGLTEQLFKTEIPGSVRSFYTEPLPERIHAWIRHFGTPWALAEISGSKLTLFIHGEFFDGGQNWRSYLLRRIVPLPRGTSPGPIVASDVKSRAGVRIAQLDFALRRLFFHAGSAMSFTWEAIRWRHFLHSSRRQRAASS